LYTPHFEEYTRQLIASSTSKKLDTSRWGNCPLCGREVMKGRNAHGCSGWKEGCPFVLEWEHKGLKLTANQIQVLLQLYILPYSVRIDDEPRLLLLSKQGFVMDIALPEGNRQQKKEDNGRPPKKRAKKDGA
jgi:DNA topoisomerase-3